VVVKHRGLPDLLLEAQANWNKSTV